MLAAGVGAGITTAGQLYANQQNIDYAKWKNNVDWAIAQQNNATQIEMANTAHQREVRDLRAAGLNPILSAGGNGASTPSLTSPEMSTPQVENPVSSFGPSARQVAQMMSDSTAADIAQKMATTSNLEAQNKNIDAQNTLIRAQADEVRNRTEIERFRTRLGPIGVQLNGMSNLIGDALKDAKRDLGSWSSRALDETQRKLKRISDLLKSSDPANHPKFDVKILDPNPRKSDGSFDRNRFFRSSFPIPLGV
jgi:hypothetical protein